MVGAGAQAVEHEQPRRPRGEREIGVRPSDLERGKIIGAAIYNPTLVSVKGTYDEVNRLCSEIADNYPWAFVNINMRHHLA